MDISGGFKAALRGITLSVHQLENPVLIFLVSLCLRVILDRRLRFRLRKCVQSAGLSGRFYLFAVILAWLLSLGPVIRLLGKEIIAGPYGWFYKWVPGFQGLRVPSRYVVVMMFGLSILAGSGARLFLGKWKSMKARILIAAVLGGLVVLDYASFPLPLAKVNVGAQIPAIYSKIRDLPEEPAVLKLPMPRHDRDEYKEAISVYYSMHHRKKIVNGYSGYSPPGYRIVREAMEAFPSFRTFQLLQDLEVTHILVHTQGAGAERGRKIVRRLREFEDQIELIEQIQGDFLYRRLPQAKIEKTEEEILSAIRDRTRWKATSSKNPDKAGLAFDGDLNTGWTTGYPQQQGDFFWLDLGSMHRLRKIELFLNNHPLDYPRSFVVEGSADGVSWVRLAEKAHFFPAISRSMIEDFSKYVVDVSFEPCSIRCLRISLTRSHEARHWSINEIVCRE
ncbi:MAG: discoidin domain-containing protein [Candidatus Aminicenantales bacterium]